MLQVKSLEIYLEVLFSLKVRSISRERSVRKTGWTFRDHQGSIPESGLETHACHVTLHPILNSQLDDPPAMSNEEIKQPMVNSSYKYTPSSQINNHCTKEPQESAVS